MPKETRWITIAECRCGWWARYGTHFCCPKCGGEIDYFSSRQFTRERFDLWSPSTWFAEWERI